MSPSSRTRLALPVVAALLGLTGCGPSAAEKFAEQDAEQITDQAREAMADLESVRMVGRLTQDDQDLAMDLAMDVDGQCTGTIDAGEGHAEFVNTDASYIKGDQAFWEAAAGEQAVSIVAVVGDKWAKVPSEAGFASSCDLDGFLTAMGEDDGDTEVEVGDLTEIEDEPAVLLTSTKDGETTKVWVAAEGTHYVLRIVTEGDQPGEFTFSDFDEPVNAEAPPADQVVDVSG